MIDMPEGMILVPREKYANLDYRCNSAESQIDSLQDRAIAAESECDEFKSKLQQLVLYMAIIDKTIGVPEGGDTYDFVTAMATEFDKLKSKLADAEKALSGEIILCDSYCAKLAELSQPIANNSEPVLAFNEIAETCGDTDKFKQDMALRLGCYAYFLHGMNQVTPNKAEVPTWQPIDSAGLIKEIMNRVCKHVPEMDSEDHVSIELPVLLGILNDCIVAQIWPLPPLKGE